MSVYSFQATSIQGVPIEMSAYRGKVLLIVNTASQCGFARQFADLQRLYDERRSRGFEILAFPCNQFNGKEPGSDAEVREICERDRGVTFPLFGKVDVTGEFAHPLFRYLTVQAPFQGFDAESEEGRKMRDFLSEKYPDLYEGDGVKWNFSKFLIDREGNVRGRFESTESFGKIEAAVEFLLRDGSDSIGGKC